MALASPMEAMEVDEVVPVRALLQKHVSKLTVVHEDTKALDVKSFTEVITNSFGLKLDFYVCLVYG